MVKPLTFKGDKPKKRKRPAGEPDADRDKAPTTTTTTTTATVTTTTQKTDENEDDDEDDLAAEDDSWVSADAVADIAGPTVLILATTPPSCLASDAHGKVFASRLETLAPDAPYTTAEPHDVRQVWVASRAAGSDGLTLKGHHGRYLACDAAGVLRAQREAVGPEEGWAVLPVPGRRGAFALRAARGTFVGVGGGGDGDGDAEVELAGAAVRGDMDEMGAARCAVRVRMQARFKPRVRRSKEQRASAKVSRRELEDAVGRRLEDGEVKRLKRARRDGSYHEALLDVKVKGKHDKFA